MTKTSLDRVVDGVVVGEGRVKFRYFFIKLFGVGLESDKILRELILVSGKITESKCHAVASTWRSQVLEFDL